MSLPYDLEDVRQRPSMYLPKPSFDVAVGYLLGINVASRGEFLDGFREWLIPKHDGGNNLAWDGLVLRLIFPNTQNVRACLGHPTGENSAIDGLFSVLEEFLAEKGRDDGPCAIRQNYRDWLRRQTWFTPASPQWTEVEHCES